MVSLLSFKGGRSKLSVQLLLLNIVCFFSLGLGGWPASRCRICSGCCACCRSWDA